MYIDKLTGDALLSALPGLAALRIEVFRAFPYLYEGTLDNEKDYITSFTESLDALIVAAKDNGRTVGCATGSALIGHAQFATAFAATKFNPGEVFYCSESVLLPAYRGQGIGHRFFDLRESHARECGYRYSAFCAVVRPDHHPQRPADYRPLDQFWRNRGYEKVPGLIAMLSWKEVGQTAEAGHTMQFWLRKLV